MLARPGRKFDVPARRICAGGDCSCSCRTPPTRGELFVESLDVHLSGRRVRSLIGVVPQENNLDPDLDVRRNLLILERELGNIPTHGRIKLDPALHDQAHQRGRCIGLRD